MLTKRASFTIPSNIADTESSDTIDVYLDFEYESGSNTIDKKAKFDYDFDFNIKEPAK